ncbi:GlsB/YeaQ/YmgE family stress response membrane protein [Ktedonosporobacter rubrisoli]|uniref:GlsB/YeaQ/YmgE family stress response membrane protein n=1 Tax=Ktedonosporobacter rubrisoli TaxID=2509675 RepID=A0A4V0YYC2_KTERU|nr:GlsB/YeaQ/YmgE family stress response membrane protein [Ktedonosporobacter rubrisoli]QBD75711.1 GlsB/YeaQ/YmgE family stress response membrane protein [Ktedonosporobacter rubrisoli]
MVLAALALGATLQPGGIIMWLILGLIAGFLASAVMRGDGYGLIGDLIFGLVGAFIGGLIMDLLMPDASFGFWGSLVVAFIGACILIAIVRAIAGARTQRL